MSTLLAHPRDFGEQVVKSTSKFTMCPTHRVKYRIGKRCPRCSDYHESKRMEAERLRRLAPATYKRRR